ncbi:MAG: hypothetical protein ABJO72_02670 [Hyphomicrobiales bacterium]
MRKILISVAFVLSLSHPALAQDGRSKVLQILGDIGPGGSPVRESVYAPRVSDILREEAMALNLGDGDAIMLRSFGNPNLIAHLAFADWNRDIPFGYGDGQAEDIPGFIGTSVSKLAEITPHDSSDLMFALRELSYQTPCGGTADLTTVIISNFIEVGEVKGDQYWWRDIMPGSPFCGDLMIIGAWVVDHNPVQGLREPALAFIQEKFKKMGFENVIFRR